MTEGDPKGRWAGFFHNPNACYDIAIRDIMEHALGIESSQPISPDGQLTLTVRTPPSLRDKVGETARTTIDIGSLDDMCSGRALVINLGQSALSENVKGHEAAQDEINGRANALLQTLAEEHDINLRMINAVDPEIVGHDAPVMMLVMTDGSKASQSILHGAIKSELASLMPPNSARGRDYPG